MPSINYGDSTTVNATMQPNVDDISSKVGYTATGIVTGEDVKIKYTAAYPSSAEVGEKEVTISSITLDGEYDNYELGTTTFAGGRGNVEPKQITIDSITLKDPTDNLVKITGEQYNNDEDKKFDGIEATVQDGETTIEYTFTAVFPENVKLNKDISNITIEKPVTQNENYTLAFQTGLTATGKVTTDRKVNITEVKLADGTARPDNNITRAEFSVLLAKFGGIKLVENQSYFPDMVDAPWSEEYVNAMAQGGYITGYEDGTFRPNNFVTRAEVVSIINRMTGRTDIDITGMVCPFVDVDTAHWAYNDIVIASCEE